MAYLAYQGINDAHGALVDAVAVVTNPGYVPVPVSLVSVNDSVAGQLVVFDGTKFSKQEVTMRLRLAADFLDMQS